MDSWFGYQKQHLIGGCQKLFVDIWGNKKHLCVYLLLWVVTAVFLYYWDTKVFIDEIPFWLAALASFGVLFICLFLYHWSRAGFLHLQEATEKHKAEIKKIEDENSAELLDVKTQKEIKEALLNQEKSALAERLAKIDIQEDVIKGACELHAKGLKLYHSGLECGQEWEDGLKPWGEEVKAYFLEHTNKSYVYLMDNTYRAAWLEPDCTENKFQDRQDARVKYSGMLIVIMDYIKDHQSGWRNDLD